LAAGSAAKALPNPSRKRGRGKKRWGKRKGWGKPTNLPAALGALCLTVTTSRHFALLAEDADDTLFRKVRYSSHHLLQTLLPEQTNHPYHLRSRTHSFKLSSQHGERNFIDRMLFKNANQSVLNRSHSRHRLGLGCFRGCAISSSLGAPF